MIKHPKDRAARRSAAAKALGSTLFRQRIRDGQRKKQIIELQERETADELRGAGENDLAQ